MEEDVMSCGIYQIRNVINSKVYIGSSKSIDVRFKDHARHLNKNKHVNQYLQNAWNKYGKDAFVFEIIENCEESELVTKEQGFIDSLKTANREYGYNICEQANKPWMTQEVKDKISKTLMGNIPWNKGIPHTEEVKQKMRKPKVGYKNGKHPMCGKKHSSESIKKMRESHLDWLKSNEHSFKGKQHSEETKEKIRTANAEHLAVLRKSQYKSVAQFKEGVLVDKFESIAEARRATGIIKINECANGNRKSAGGFTWKFCE